MSTSRELYEITQNENAQKGHRVHIAALNLNIIEWEQFLSSLEKDMKVGITLSILYLSFFLYFSFYLHLVSVHQDFDGMN